MTPPLLTRLDARDRALFTRFALDARSMHRRRWFWTGITHLGGSRGSIGACIAATVFPQVTVAMAWRALVLLGLTHLMVQIVKRFAVRERPNVRMSTHALISIPDRFSFPSGHACAAMAVAASFAAVFPTLALPLLGVAMLVGFSRVVLGVHYPGDVVVGQAIALISVYGLSAIG